MNHFLLLSAAMSEQDMMRAMSVGDKMGSSLMVMLIGLAVVFLGLVILIAACKILSIAFSKQKQAPKKAVQDAPKTAAPVPAAPAAPVQPQDDSDELAAVIAAVIAAMGQAQTTVPKGGFVVRRVRRVGNSSNWAAAGREELLSSKYF
jgi:sodium pump decarboxylase gamma subunit